MRSNNDLLPEIPDAVNSASNGDLLAEIPDISKYGLASFMRLKPQGKQPLYHPGFPKSIVEGINEGAEAGTAAIAGKNLQLSQLPQDEWERGGEKVGRFVGSMAPITGIAAPLIATGGAVGLPAAEAIGFGSGAFAATPGTKSERALSAAETLLIPKATQLGIKAIDKMIATPLSNFLEGTRFGNGENISLPVTKNIPEMQQQLEKHNQAHQTIQDAENEAKRIAQIETGKKSPGMMRFEKNKIAQQESGLPPSSEMRALEQPYHLEKDLVTSQEKLDNLNDVIDSDLGKEKQHDVRIARRVFDSLDKEREYIGQGYNALEKNYEDKSIIVKKTKGIEQAIKELSGSVSPEILNSPEGKNLITLVSNMESHDVIPAKNYLAALRTARDLAKKMRDKQYSYGTNAEERLSLDEKATDLEDKYQKANEVFKDTLGGEDANALDALNKAWRTRVVPLQRNKVYQTMRFDKRLNWDMIHELRGDVKGNDIIKAAIKSDPETLKLVLGQRYYEKPESLFEPNETAQEYLDHAPQVKSMLDTHRKLSENINRLNEYRKGVYGKSKEMNESLFKRNEFKKRNNLLDKHIEELERISKEKDRIKKEIAKVKFTLKEHKLIKQKGMEDILGFNMGDLVPPTYKIPYKFTKNVLKKILGKGDK